MITFFNGRRRGLGEPPASQVYAQIDASFREYLHVLKGAKLAVFLAIALHANEEGWSWPSYETLSRETGYSLDKIRDALAELCSLEINGQRILLRYQPQQSGGKFATNRYLLFPTPEEVEQFENAGVPHPGDTGNGFCRGGKTPPRSPWWQNTTTDRGGKTPPQTITMLEPEPNFEEEEEEERGGDCEIDEIAGVLQESGVFPENAVRIAARMSQAGLTPQDALEIFRATLQAAAQPGLAEEQVIARAVYRLEQGIWDAGERAREAIRRARHRTSSPGVVSGIGQSDEALRETDPGGRIWQAALGELQLELTRATFETWLRNSRLVACEDGVFVIGVANTYAREWLESRLRSVVERVLARLTGEKVSVRFVTGEANFCRDVAAAVHSSGGAH
jgi:hypothetical protein